MATITAQDAQAWTEPTKLDIMASGLDDDLESAVATQVLARLAQTLDTSTWTTPTATPRLIRGIISMIYIAWVYQKAYAGDNNSILYANILIGRSNDLIQGIIDGSILIAEIPVGDQTAGEPMFYPNDASSAQTRPMNDQDTGWGPPVFTMGVVW